MGHRMKLAQLRSIPTIKKAFIPYLCNLIEESLKKKGFENKRKNKTSKEIRNGYEHFRKMFLLQLDIHQFKCHNLIDPLLVSSMHLLYHLTFQLYTQSISHLIHNKLYSFKKLSTTYKFIEITNVP